MTEKRGSGPDQRRYQRIKTTLLGRYMLADRREAKCMVIDVSLSGIAIAAPEKGAIGETVVLYVDRIGRVEGTIVRHIPEGFALQLDVTSRAIERIAARLAEMESAGTLSPSPERRQEARIKVDELPGRRTLAGVGSAGGAPGCRVVDVSFTGADVKIVGPRPAIGSLLDVGKLKGKVVRHTAAGVAVEFIDPPAAATLIDRIADLTQVRPPVARPAPVAGAPMPTARQRR